MLTDIHANLSTSGLDAAISSYTEAHDKIRVALQLLPAISLRLGAIASLLGVSPLTMIHVNKPGGLDLSKAQNDGPMTCTYEAFRMLSRGDTAVLLGVEPQAISPELAVYMSRVTTVGKTNRFPSPYVEAFATLGMHSDTYLGIRARRFAQTDEARYAEIVGKQSFEERWQRILDTEPSGTFTVRQAAGVLDVTTRVIMQWLEKGWMEATTQPTDSSQIVIDEGKLLTTFTWHSPAR